MFMLFFDLSLASAICHTHPGITIGMKFNQVYKNGLTHKKFENNLKFILTPINDNNTEENCQH